jgi:hypothetical protein
MYAAFLGDGVRNSEVARSDKVYLAIFREIFTILVVVGKVFVVV